MAKKNNTNASINKNKGDSNAPSLFSISPKKEIDFKLVASLGFVFSLVLLIFSYKQFGSYFEMNDDPRYVMAMKGFASPHPYDNFVSVYKLTVNLYISLYQKFPTIGWYGLSMFLLLWGALFNIYIALYLVAKNRINFLLTQILFLAFFFLVFFQNVYWTNFTRPSILATSSFIIFLAVLYLHFETFIKHKWILIFPIITYVLAHLTRLDAGYLGFAFGTTFSVLLIFKQKKLLPFLLKFLTPVICFILIIKVIDYSSQKNDSRNHDFLEKTEIIRQLFDYKNLNAYVPKDIKDTMAYNALMYGRYCSDDKVISLEFLKKLTNNSPLLVSGNKKKFDDEFGAFLKSLDNENSFAKKLNYSLLGVLLIGLFVSFKSNYISFLKYVLFQVFFIAVVAAMSYYMKLPARIYNPLFVLLTLGNIVFVFSILKFDKKQFYYILLVPLLLLVFNISTYAKANKKLIAEYKQYGQVNTMMVNDMNNKFQNTIFIPTNLRSWEMHNATDPIKEINFKNKNCYVYLSIELSLTPETKDQLINKFGTDDHSKLFKKISEMNNVVFISDESYNNFLRAYYHYLYNQDYYFEKVTEAPFYQATGLNYYRLKAIK